MSKYSQSYTGHETRLNLKLSSASNTRDLYHLFQALARIMENILPWSDPQWIQAGQGGGTSSGQCAEGNLWCKSGSPWWSPSLLHSGHGQLRKKDALGKFTFLKAKKAQQHHLGLVHFKPKLKNNSTCSPLVKMAVFVLRHKPRTVEMLHVWGE